MSEKSQIEKDFEEVVDQVNEKLREAAQAVREAQKIAETKGFSVMTLRESDYRPSRYVNINSDDDYYDLDLAFASRELEQAMAVAGWRPSSWNC
jgi:uncharacterized protein (UPF0210 family)